MTRRAASTRMAGLWAAMMFALSLMIMQPAAGQEAAAEGEAEQPAARVVVLDTAGSWRVHPVLAPPILDGEDGLQPVPYGPSWISERTAEPGEGWQKVDFDDGGWLRAPARVVNDTPFLARLSLRGTFMVNDPGQVEDLLLQLAYCGGVRVTLNGHEIGRQHLPAGAITPQTLAEEYPLEAFVTAKGELNTYRGRGAEDQRVRTLEVRISNDLLLKGRNVLGIDIVRSPYHRVHHEKKAQGRGRGEVLVLHWGTCDIRRVQLSAGSAEGVTGGGVRPTGFQVWNSDAMVMDFDADFGNPAEPLRPIRLAGARRGRYSGKVVVGSDTPIKGLRAEVSSFVAADAAGSSAAIAAAAARIRYSLPWGSQTVVRPYRGHYPPYPVQVEALDALVDEPPAEVPVREKSAWGDYQAEADDPKPVSGAVAGVWLTVTVPPDAKAGLYRGKVSIRAEGVEEVVVPVELEVLDWSLPDPQDYHTWVEMIQSPDTLAVTYGLEMWSEEHWRMIEQSFRLLASSGSRVLHVPLIAQTNLGNAESMIRWKPRSDGTYEVDFSIVERYLDVATKHMGQPKLVCFWVWDIYMIEKKENARSDHLWLKEAIEARKGFVGKGPLVTMVDAESGELKIEHLAPLAAPVSKGQWKPVMDRLHEIMDARGLRQAMTLGMLNDVRPSKEDVSMFHELSPGTPWISHAHHSVGLDRLLYGVAAARYEANVWSLKFASDPEKPMHGWNNDVLRVEYDRSRGLNSTPPVAWHYMTESNIVGGQRGVGRLGADFWPAIEDRRGALRGYVWSRYLQSSWRNLDIHSHMLAAGPEGPVGTARLEAFNEGVQHSEARIRIEKALIDAEERALLGEEFAVKLEAFLAERVRQMYRGQADFQMNNPHNAVNWRSGAATAGPAWFATSGWQQSSAELYRLAGEVERRLVKKQ